MIEFKEKLQSFFPQKEFCPSFYEILELLYKKILEENQKVNLTRITQKQDFFYKHILDSMLILKVIKTLPKDYQILDIGCGGGFPSFILALIYPNTKIFALDSIGKKIKAIDNINNSLKLKNIITIKARAGEIAKLPQYYQKFHFVTARAVASSEKLIRETYPFLKNKGTMIFYKTPHAIEKEKKLLEKETKKYSLKSIYSPKFSLIDKNDRQFIILKKFK